MISTAETEPIRVLHVITALPVGGTQTMLLKLVENLKPPEYEARVVSLTEVGDTGQRIKELGHQVTSLGLNRGPSHWGNIHRLARVISEFRPHILQTWLYHADLIGLLIGRFYGVQKIAWNLRCSFMGDTYAGPRRRLLLRALAKLSHMPDALITNSIAGRQWHLSLGYRVDRWTVIPNGFDTQLFRPNAEARSTVRQELGIPENDKVVGLVARYDPIKGHDLFLSAAAKLLAYRKDLHFVLVGDGCVPENEQLRDLRSKTAHPSNVHLVGKRKDIERVTAALDIAACTSIGEGFPNVLGEAMACGVPCVATDVGDCAKIIAKPDWIALPGDADDFTRALENALALQPSQREALGREVRERIITNYSLDAIIRQYKRLYTELARSFAE